MVQHEGMAPAWQRLGRGRASSSGLTTFSPDKHQGGPDAIRTDILEQDVYLLFILIPSLTGWENSYFET